jgi:glycosyltransferase involved in cell wall biosynthesis
LPLALHEMDRLQAHVSDFYCPDVLYRPRSRLLQKLSPRYREGLPSRKVRVDFRALKQNFSSPVQTVDPFFSIDRSLSVAAARLATHTGSHLFLHSQYAYWAFKMLPDRVKFLYQFHPHAASVRELLEKDYSIHPEVRWSFDNELDSLPPERQRREALEEWTMADGIVCASSFTKESLVKQGCTANSISVVPYGIFPDANRSDNGGPGQTVCRFIFVGLGVQRKGLHLLLKAWKRAAMKAAELFVVARKMDPGIGALLDQPNVRYIPGVDRATLDELYRESAIFVMPSLVEGFGLVYLEALSRGLHCIGTANTGLPDLYLPAFSATIVPTDSLEPLVHSLHRCAEEFRSGRMNKEQIRRSVAGFTWDHQRAELRALVAKMLESKATRPLLGVQ